MFCLYDMFSAFLWAWLAKTSHAAEPTYRQRFCRPKMLVGRRSFPFGKGDFQGPTVSFREATFWTSKLDILQWFPTCITPSITSRVSSWILRVSLLFEETNGCSKSSFSSYRYKVFVITCVWIAWNWGMFWGHVETLNRWLAWKTLKHLELSL